MEGTDTVHVNEGTVVARPKIRICASGDRLRFILKSYRQVECTQVGQTPPGWAWEFKMLPVAISARERHIDPT